jgi:hypothetical protein
MHEERSMPMVGGSSLLVIFSVLCLTMFALLSMSEVQAYGRLSDKSAESAEAYYAADCEAQQILAQLRSGELPPEVTVQGNEYYYVCTVSDTQQLEVEVRIDGSAYTILRWQTVSVAEWEPDYGLSVWNGT